MPAIAASTKAIPTPRQLLTILQGLLSGDHSCLVKRAIDGEQTYPGVEFIGWVGFDVKQQRFVLVEMENVKENKIDRFDLSEREQEVLQLVARGCTNTQIARKLIITENTVKVHLQNIFAKLNVRNRTEAALCAIRGDLATG